MEFELSSEVVNQLIFSMEDQKGRYVFDSIEQKLVAASNEKLQNTDRYLPLPDWDSISGFKVMEQFVAGLRNPLAREQLRSVLFAGKGAFRNFKNVLKEYPEVERRWFLFKQKEMKQKIFDWYNLLRDSWGMERMGDEPEETENVVHEDFIFCEYDSLIDAENLAQVEQSALEEMRNMYPEEIGEAAVYLFRIQKDLAVRGSDLILVARTAAADLAGFIRLIPFPPQAKKTVMISAFFVFSAWRGMGVGGELFLYCLNEIRKRGIRWVLIIGSNVPQIFEQFLLREGFKKTMLGFLADLIQIQ